MTIKNLSTKTHTLITSPITFDKLVAHGLIKNGKYKGYKVELNSTAQEDMCYIMNDEYLKMWHEINPQEETGNIKISKLPRPNVKGEE